MLERLKKAFKKNVEPLLPPSVQRLVNDTREMRDLPGGLIQDGQDELEQMLNASPLGQKVLDDLLKDKKKHIGSMKRGSNVVVEITDERSDTLNPIHPDEVRALLATHLAKSTKLPDGLRIHFSSKTAER